MSIQKALIDLILLGVAALLLAMATQKWIIIVNYFRNRRKKCEPDTSAPSRDWH